MLLQPGSSQQWQTLVLPGSPRTATTQPVASSTPPAAVDEEFRFVESAAAGGSVAAISGDKVLTLLDGNQAVVGSVAYTETRRYCITSSGA